MQAPSEPPSLDRRSRERIERTLKKLKPSPRHQPSIISNFQPESYIWKKFVSLDGEDRLYTTILLICMNLALLVWFFERGILEGREDTVVIDDIDAGVAAKRLVRSAILILCAVLNGLVVFTMLAINLRDLESVPKSVSMRWIFTALLGFLIANMTTVGICYSAEEAYQWRRDNDKYDGPFPHYMILGVFVFCILTMNLLFIRNIYLPFISRRPSGWAFIRRNLATVIELGRRERGETSFCENVSHLLMSVLNKIVGFFNLMVYHYFNFYEGIIVWVWKLFMEDTSCLAMKELSRLCSELALAPARFVRWSPIVQAPLFVFHVCGDSIGQISTAMFRPVTRFAQVARLQGHRREASWHVRVFRGLLTVNDRFTSLFTTFKPEVQKAANELWENVKEDDEYHHSSWLKAAVVTAIVLLVYFGVSMIDYFNGYMDDVYRPTRDCIIENPGVSNFFLRFIGFAPSNSNSTIEDGVSDNICAAALTTLQSNSSDPDLISNITTSTGFDEFIPTAITQTSGTDAAMLSAYTQQLVQRVEENRTEDRLYKCDEGKRQDNVCVMLAAVNMAEDLLGNASRGPRQPSDEFFESFSGEMVYVFDVYLRKLDWTVWIGFVVGLIFGFWTLLSVMGQYKRLSLAIRSGLFIDFDMERHYEVSKTKSQKMGLLQRVDSVITTNSFAKVIMHYPMSTSIFFSGMLISTAVLQLVVFGGLVASVFALLAALTDAEVLNIVTPFLWTLFAFFVTWLVNGPIATMVLGEGLLVSRFQVIHEILFFVFLLVFTSIHLVVGVFLAFFRMLWVLLTALVTINRLDKNLFVVYKERDIGHKSFMALILMQHVFHVNRAGNHEQRSTWEDILRQLENQAIRDSLKEGRTCAHSRHESEPVHLLDDDALQQSHSRRLDAEETAERGESTFQSDRRIAFDLNNTDQEIRRSETD